jgi:hypothetical protein
MQSHPAGLSRIVSTVNIIKHVTDLAHVLLHTQAFTKKETHTTEAPGPDTRERTASAIGFVAYDVQESGSLTSRPRRLMRRSRMEEALIHWVEQWPA